MDNRKLLQQEAQVFTPASRIKYFDVVLKSGQNAVLKDVEGNEYLDLLASASSANTGHAHPHVVEAIQQQAEQLIGYTPAYFANHTTTKLAQKLASVAPMSEPVQITWGNSGSDANDAIIKFARAYTKRPYVACFTGAYHGSTYGSMGVSSISLNMARKMGPFMPGIIRLPFPDSHERLENETEHEFVQRMYAAFLQPFQTYVPPEEVAVILIEAIQGDGGIVKMPPEYLKLIAEFAKQNGILLAVDEVNQGLGRTGEFWSIQHFDVEPDLLSVGKSLGSGLPISAVIGKKKIMEALNSPANVYTTAGNPISAAAALATLEVIENENLVQRSRELGEIARDFFVAAREKYDFIGDVRMYGLNGGIDIIDPQTKLPDSQRTAMLITRIFELGAIMISLRGNILRFQPPLVITKEQLQQAFALIEQAFAELAANKLQVPDNANEIGW